MVKAQLLDTRLGLDPQGRTVDELAQALAQIAGEADQAYKSTLEEWDLFLRPEAVAGMLWLHRLPQVGEGPYCLVDVGAATVHASFFRVHHVHAPDETYIQKGGIALFGADTQLCGMDRIGHGLVKAGAGGSHVEIRGKEAQLLRQPRWSNSVRVELKEMQQVWRSADRAAHQLDMCTSSREGLQWLVVGGGSQVGMVREQFADRPTYLGQVVGQVAPIGGSTRPEDLRQVPDRSGRSNGPYGRHAEFLMVAYGLSLPRDAAPEISLPFDQRGVRITRPGRVIPTFEDLGYD